MPQLPSMKASIKCPHCLESFTGTWQERELGADKFSLWWIRRIECPACGNYIFFLRRSIPEQHGDRTEVQIMVWPKVEARAVLSADVPSQFANDYKEACIALADSPKASAALSRRCLQHLLRERGGVKPGDLANEIQQILDSQGLPSHLAEAIDAVRNIGNFAAHPTKNKSTGEIVEVEPGEAEWLLDTLEGLFDFYFVQPAILKQRRDTLNQKLSEAGKPPMK